MNSYVEEIEHCWVTMSDGIRLSARLWLPEGRPAPAIVEYIPYRKRDMVRARDERNHPWFAERGYACIRVDMRGSGDSEGVMADMYSTDELSDAQTVLAWISQQPWCDGSIGMMGTSWGGSSALQAAVSGSGLLKAVIAVCATNDRYNDDIHHMGGCLLTDSVEWGATLPAILALPPAQESDPDGWRQNWLNRLESLEFPLFSWIEREKRDDYWRYGSVVESDSGFDCPVLAIGGWSDRYSNTVMNVVADSPKTCWGIVGPWGHHYPDQGTPGPAIGFQQEALRWWDRWLRDEPNGIDEMPRLRVWCHTFQSPADFIGMRNGKWLAVADWPAEGFTESYLDIGPAQSSISASARVPADLRVGRAAGDSGYFGRAGGLPLDQSTDDEYSLVFESRPLDSNQQLFGKASVELIVRSAQLPAQIIARLCDVSPLGEVVRVAYRVHNLSLNEDYSARNQESVEEGFPLKLTLPNACYEFAAGHRIRISLSTSYWPLIWPTDAIPDLSIDSSEIKLLMALAPPGAYCLPSYDFDDSLSEVNRDPGCIAERIQRYNEFDDISGNLTQGWRQLLSMAGHPAVELEIGAETIAEHRINIGNPQSAQSCFTHRLVLVNQHGRIESIGSAKLRSINGYFMVEGSINVIENDSEVFSRSWSRKIKRKYS